MSPPRPASEAVDRDTSARIERYVRLLSTQLQNLRERLYPPEAQKSFTRVFSTQDVSRLLNVPESTLRTLTLEGKGPLPEINGGGRRQYTLAHLAALRTFLAEARPDEALHLDPRRRPGEKLQVLSASNFKGGSGKTSTSLHLAHYLAIQGLRVLCIDLDPQASLTTTFGVQPEFDIGENETIYAALRYDRDRRPLSEVIRPTYFLGIDLVPGNLEVQDFEFDTAMALRDRVRDGHGLFFERLHSALAEVEDRYDVVVLDTPPSLGYVSLTALYAATGLIITTAAAMLDVASVNQYLLMIMDITGVLADSGAPALQHDFTKFLLTRYDPNDLPSKTVSGLLRSLFGDDVLLNEAYQSTAVQAAGLAKKSLYELEPGSVGRDALKRALESQDAVNGEIFKLIRTAWGRPS